MSSLVVLISGRGSNLKALLDSPVGQHVSVVIADRVASGLRYAGERNVAAEIVDASLFTDREAFEEKLAATIDHFSPDLIALAGFMRVLSPEFVRRYCGRLVNIHPSLLPKYPGLDTHRRALEAGELIHGCSVHWVDQGVDTGPVIRQRAVKILPDDDPESLAMRVLTEEHDLYAEVIADILGDREQPPAAQ